MDDASLFRFPPGLSHACRSTTALDWSAWNVQNDPVDRHADARPAPAAIRRRASRKAVEMCNNNGHCRKFDAGTMCPSYRVDARRGAPDARPRQHAAPRAVRPARRRGARVASRCATALDLCVSCKGCRRECPTGVDMAKMKIEFAASAGSARTGCRCATALIAHLPRWAPWAARLPWLANLRDTLPGAARLTEALAGLLGAAHAAALAARHVPARARPRADAVDGDADVVLFVDTFTNYFEPENAHAALRVLRAAGYRVHVARAAARRRASRRGRCAAAGPFSPRASSTRRSAKRAAWSPRWRRTSRAARRSSGSSRRACCRCATSSW